MNWAAKGISILLATFFLGGIFLCVGIPTLMNHSMSMEAPCPMTTGNHGCTTPSDHISYWSNILSVIPSDFAALVLALVAACACVWLVCRGILNPFKILRVLEHATSPPFQYIPRHSLQEAFSNGILHPKLYQVSS